MEKRAWPVILIILCFVLITIYMILNDLNYRKETTYREIQIDTYMVYSDWYRFIGTLRGLLLTTNGVGFTLDQADELKAQVEKRLDDLGELSLVMDDEIQASLKIYIGSMRAGLKLGQELIDNGRLFLQQPDLPEVFQEGRVALSSITGKDITSVMGNLSAYQYYQMVRRLKSLNLLFDQLYSDQLEILLNKINQRAEQVRRSFFILRLSVLLITILSIALLVFQLLRLNKFLRRLADSTRKELKNTQSHLNEVQGFLQNAQYQQSLFEMVAGLSHELNTPLGNCMSVSTYLESSLTDFKKQLEQGELDMGGVSKGLESSMKGFQLIENNLEHMKLQIDTFKRLSSVNHGYEGAKVSLETFIEGEFKHSTQLCGIDVTIQKSPWKNRDLKIYVADIKQIMLQLLENSKAHAKATSAEVSFIESEDALSISYQDNGTDFVDEHIDRVAEPFFTTNRGSNHMGLGLSIIVSLISNKLQGEIQFHNKKGSLLVLMKLPLKFLQ